jgi:aromatic ring-opening dioxygenase LigB subunit
MERYSFTVNSANTLRGSFAKFGVDEIYEFENDFSFADKLAFAASMNEIPAHLHESFLDHGTLIPLYHLLKNINPKVVSLSFSMMDYAAHYRYGDIIRELNIKGFGGRVAVIASADLSHKLTPASPAGYSPSAQQFDQGIVHYLGANDQASLLALQPVALLEAAECGMRSIIILLGALHGLSIKFDLLSYEHPFGIGYLTARLV